MREHYDAEQDLKVLTTKPYKTFEIIETKNEEKKFKITNGDKIRAMSNAELARFIKCIADDCSEANFDGECSGCHRKFGCAYQGNYKWLESEAQEDEQVY